MQLLCCDVDGTVFNSRELVRRAYQEVGVTQPDGAWGRRWQDWLIDYFDGDEGRALTAHAQKTQRYMELLIRTDLQQYALPAAVVARHWFQRHGDRSVSYLTAGTRATAFSALSRLGIAGRMLGGLTYDQRLAALLDTPRGTVYLDDNAETIAQLRADAPDIIAIDIRGMDQSSITSAIRHRRLSFAHS